MEESTRQRERALRAEYEATADELRSRERTLLERALAAERQLAEAVKVGDVARELLAVFFRLYLLLTQAKES